MRLANSRRIITAILGLIGIPGVVFLCSCEGPATLPLTEKDVATTYVASADWGSSTLVLHPDHTFNQSVDRDDHIPPTMDHSHSCISGTWQLKLVEGFDGMGGFVTLKPFLAVGHDRQGVFSTAGLPSIARIGGNRIEIAADPDYGIEFQSK